MINDIKNKLINLKLDKVDNDFIKFNNNKNNKQLSLLKRHKQINNAKEKLNKSPIVNFNITKNKL